MTCSAEADNPFSVGTQNCFWIQKTLNVCLFLVRSFLALGGHSDVVSVLLDAGADIDLREGDCDTPYANACHVLLTAAPHMPRAA